MRPRERKQADEAEAAARKQADTTAAAEEVEHEAIARAEAKEARAAAKAAKTGRGRGGRQDGLGHRGADDTARGGERALVVADPSRRSLLASTPNNATRSRGARVRCAVRLARVESTRPAREVDCTLRRKAPVDMLHLCLSATQHPHVSCGRDRRGRPGAAPRALSVSLSVSRSQTQ